MGFFGRFVYSGGEWRDEPQGGEYLAIDIHDSDIAAIQYAPSPTARLFYLGHEPRDYFEDPSANVPVDRSAEAEAFAGWARRHLDAELKASEVLSLMAETGASEPIDVFVEETVVTLLERLGLPLPAELEAAPEE